MLCFALHVWLCICYVLIVHCDNTLNLRTGCSKGYSNCSPKGASTNDEPPIGPALSSFYVDIINTVDGTKKDKRELFSIGDALNVRSSGGHLCCVEGSQCLLLQDIKLPFCYDNYTTNYFLPAGFSGQIVSGNYTSPDGSTANLLSGDYSIMGGDSGNIYGSPLATSKPDLATLAIPTQYTASGSGSAIEATALGEQITFTTILPGKTTAASVVSAITTSIFVSADGLTNSIEITEAVSTIPGTTVAAQTSTVTTRLAGASPASTSAAHHAALKGMALAITILAEVLINICAYL